jgi:flagellar biogenesis protein FliO
MKFGQPAATAQAGAILIRSYGMLVVLLGLTHLAVWLVMRSRNVSPSNGTNLA